MIVQPQTQFLVGQFLEHLQKEALGLEIKMLLALCIPAHSSESLPDARGTRCQCEEHIFI